MKTVIALAALASSFALGCVASTESIEHADAGASTTGAFASGANCCVPAAECERLGACDPEVVKECRATVDAGPDTDGAAECCMLAAPGTFCN